VSRALPLVLASTSPRRRELLGRLGVAFETCAIDVDETPRDGEPPRDLVERLALAKARAGASAGAATLAADTIVALEGVPLGKPGDDGEATRMLQELSGRDHEVWTGVALVFALEEGAPPVELVRSCRTRVRFRALSDDEIGAYVATGEPADRAGAYAIQGGAARFVDELDGELTNVVGLPLPLVSELLREMEAVALADSPPPR